MTMNVAFKEGILNILKLFYADQDAQSIHLREIARRTKLNENSVSRFLKVMEKGGLIKSTFDGNLKKFSMEKRSIPPVFEIFDRERYEALPAIRRNAVQHFFERLPEKPLAMTLFGSTAKQNYTETSDVDLLLVTNSKIATDDARDYAESQTGIRINDLQIRLDEFKQELRLKRDAVIQSAVKTGYPVFNSQFYHEVKYGNESA